MKQSDSLNLEFDLARGFIEQTNHPVFLTGKAGTGKTTFLKYIKKQSIKNTVVVAPTGVAAINASGTTIHSFFQLPFSPFIPGKAGFSSRQASDRHQLLGNLRLTTERKELMEAMELLIIDEISMVRCDVLDAIDTVMRHVRRQYELPFGGVQVLFIGDMYQLPPVIKNEEWSLLSELYETPFFFSSRVIHEHPPVYIELQNVYRQHDVHFINLLNHVRNNEMDEDDFNLLNERVIDTVVTEEHDRIVLTTHNNKADAINAEALQNLEGKNYAFTASVQGLFAEQAYPADELLQLKIGAQVMFLKNDMEKERRYYNGKIGQVRQVDDEKVWVECENISGPQLIEVKKETWKNVRYSLNATTRHIEEEQLGTFTQFPLRLAWAITIHKSQGLTFDKVTIDAARSFAAGQVYVALSRCTSLMGIKLLTKISASNLHSDTRIVEFASKQKTLHAQEQILLNASREYQQQLIYSLFNFENLGDLLSECIAWAASRKWNNLEGWFSKINTVFVAINTVAKKFHNELQSFFYKNGIPTTDEDLQKRLVAAVSWFIPRLEELKTVLVASPAITDNRADATMYNNFHQKTYNRIGFQLHLLKGCVAGFQIEQFQSTKNSFKTEASGVNAFSGKSALVPVDMVNAALYQQLREKRNEIAARKDIPLFMVCKTQSLEEMARLLPATSTELKLINGFGAAKVKQYGFEFLGLINGYCDQNDIIREEFKPFTAVTVRKKVKKEDTKAISYELYRSGKTIGQIAEERKLAIGTIENHLAKYIESGELNIDELVTLKEQEEIRKVLHLSDTVSMNQVKEKVPSASYSQIRWVMAAHKRATGNSKASAAEIIL